MHTHTRKHGNGGLEFIGHCVDLHYNQKLLLLNQGLITFTGNACFVKEDCCGYRMFFYVLDCSHEFPVEICFPPIKFLRWYR